MHRLLILPALLTFGSVQAEPVDYFQQPPRAFFSAGESDFFSIEDHQPLRRIQAEGAERYMTQDGDLYDEDIASLDPPSALGARQADFSFSQAKYQLARTIYKDYNIAFYSGCRFKAAGKQLVPDWASCGYKPRKNPARAKRIEWEHVVPAWVFGHQLQCWQKGGRAACRNQPQFRQMEADMHNLVPAIGEINGDRSNLPYGMVSGEERAYGAKVNMEIDFQGRTAEPPDTVYGDVARIHFYMRDRYQLTLSDQQSQLLVAWNNLDPVDAWEQKRNTLIQQVQGNDNPYVSQYRKLDNGKNGKQASPSPSAIPAPENWVDELYLLVHNNRDTLPYSLVALATLLYLGYLKFRRPRPKARPKAAPKASSKTSKAEKETGRKQGD